MTEKTSSAALRALAMMALAQAPFWVATSNIHILRPLFNLDMALAMIVGTLYRPLGVVGVIVAWAVEILRDASHNYHFADAADFLSTVRFANLVGLRHVLSWQVVLFVAGMAGCAWLIGRGLKGDRVLRCRLAGFLFGLSCLLGAVDALNGSNSVLGPSADRFRFAVNVAGSAGWNSLHDAIGARAASALPMRRFEQARSYQRVYEWKRAHPDSSALLVLVESMGLPRAPGVRNWLYARLDTPAVEQRWMLERGSEPFYGPTTFGELRVLCGLRGYYSRLKPSDETTCLPRQFAALGQPSLALHGFSLHMFDRDHWWPELGLQPQGFGGDEHVPANVHCNDAFNGVCDGVVLRHAVALADTPGRFVYVVTLDTHLPLTWRLTEPPADLQQLCGAEGVSPVACRMVDMLGNVLSQLAVDLAGMQHPPLVVVAGDHAPPFVQRDDREAFDADQVTWLALQPRPAP